MHLLLSSTRLQAIDELQAARPSRDALEKLTLKATEVMGVPASFITLVTVDRQFTMAVTGVAADGSTATTASFEMPTTQSICQWIIANDAPLVIDDTMAMDMTCSLDCVIHGGIRAYMGHPISSWSGEPVGSFCVVDYKPRAWSRADRMLLASLASSASVILLQAVLATEVS